MWPKPSGNYWSCEDIVGVVGDTLGVFSVATTVAMAAAFNASFAEAGGDDGKVGGDAPLGLYRSQHY